MDPAAAVDWAQFAKDVAALAVDAALWVMIARLVGSTLHGAFRG